MTDYQTKVDNNNALRPIIASLYYLSQESSKSGYEDVSKIILAAISRVEAVVEGQGNNIIDIIVSQNTIKALQILDIVSKYPLDRYAYLSTVFELAESDLTESADESEEIS